jgi:hypothetical protein
MPLIMMYVREKTEKTMTKAYKSWGKIICIHYGPYDNRHILVGLSTGDFFAFDTILRNKICNIKVSDNAITQITIEPTTIVFISVRQTQEVTALTFIQTK